MYNQNELIKMFTLVSQSFLPRKFECPVGWEGLSREDYV
jgi:hypothetical protein